MRGYDDHPFSKTTNDHIFNNSHVETSSILARWTFFLKFAHESFGGHKTDVNEKLIEGEFSVNN